MKLHCSKKFRLICRLIKVKYIADITSRIQEKYSVSHKENRVYNHRLYEICIDNLSEISQKNDFLKNGKHFYWMTLGEMAKDDNIAKKNLDVIDFVKEVFG